MLSKCLAMEDLWTWNFVGIIKSLSPRFKENRTLLPTIWWYSSISTKARNYWKETEIKTNCKRHCLSHHPVVTLSKSTTKVRKVYDASAKAAKGVKCLNDCQYQELITLPDLCGVLLRLYSYCLMLMLRKLSFKLVFKTKIEM